MGLGDGVAASAKAYIEGFREQLQRWHGLVLLPIPMDYHRITEHTAKLMVEAQGRTDTPLCPIWMSDRLGEGFRVFDAAGMTLEPIRAYPTPPRPQKLAALKPLAASHTTSTQ